jgi:hypothetical protein
LNEDTLPRHTETYLDTAYFFVLGVSITTALLMGIMPAFSSRVNINETSAKARAASPLAVASTELAAFSWLWRLVWRSCFSSVPAFSSSFIREENAPADSTLQEL